MNVRIIIGATGAYACMSDPSFSFDVRLEPGRGAAAALRERAAEYADKAQEWATRAERCMRAAEILESTTSGA